MAEELGPQLQIPTRRRPASAHSISIPGARTPTIGSRGGTESPQGFQLVKDRLGGVQSGLEVPPPRAMHESQPVHRVVQPAGPSRSFSGADIKAVVHVYNSGVSKPMVIANAQTISYSVHREKVPVRALGRTYPTGFTRGGRTIGGSIVFTMFDREVLWDIIQAYAPDTEWNDGTTDYSSWSPMLDQLPPFDMTITFANEHGDVANMAIYGMEIVDEGAVLSIDDMLVEKTVSWVARDIDMVRPYSNAPNFAAFGKDVSTQGVTQDDINAFLQTLKERRDTTNRTNPASGDSVWRYDIPYDYAIFADTATQDRMHGVLPAGTPVTYNRNGILWIGTAFPELGQGSNIYKFIPDAVYPGSISNPLRKVHTEFIDTADIPYSDNIPGNMIMDISGDILVDRGTIQKRLG